MPRSHSPARSSRAQPNEPFFEHHHRNVNGGAARAAVFGISDEARGQEIMAAVTLMPGQTVDAGDLIAFAQEQVAAYKYPRRVEILEVLPLGPSGKVLKRELVARFETA